MEFRDDSWSWKWNVYRLHDQGGAGRAMHPWASQYPVRTQVVIADPWLKVQPHKTLLNPRESTKNKLLLIDSKKEKNSKMYFSGWNSLEFLKTNTLNEFPLKSVNMVTKS